MEDDDVRLRSTVPYTRFLAFLSPLLDSPFACHRDTDLRDQYMGRGRGRAAMDLLASYHHSLKFVVNVKGRTVLKGFISLTAAGG